MERGPEVVLYTDDATGAIAEIASAGGRVLHVLTPTVLVAELPPAAELRASTTARPAGLDPGSVRAVKAWVASRSTSRSESIPWDAPGFEPPG